MFDIIKMNNGEYALTKNGNIVHCDCIEGVVDAIPDFIQERNIAKTLTEKAYNL